MTFANGTVVNIGGQKYVLTQVSPARKAKPAPAPARARAPRATVATVEKAYYGIKSITPKSDRPALREALGFGRVTAGDTTRMETCREWVERVGVRAANKALASVQ